MPAVEILISPVNQRFVCLCGVGRRRGELSIEKASLFQPDLSSKVGFVTTSWVTRTSHLASLVFMLPRMGESVEVCPYTWLNPDGF